MAGRVEAFQRDLARQPLSAKELAAFAAVVLDPPHGERRHRSRRSPPPGCRPWSMSVATRQRCLGTRGVARCGYTLAAATAIDQFLWSARLESVSVFRRG